MITHRKENHRKTGNWDCPIVRRRGSLGLGVGDRPAQQEEVSQRQGADTRVVGLDNGGLRGHRQVACFYYR